VCGDRRRRLSLRGTPLTIFTQDGYRCRLEWGRHGARQAAERGDITVIVDTLSFSSAVATAIHHGAVVYPCATTDDLDALAAKYGAEVAVRRHEVPSRGRFSLSPPTYVGVAPGTAIIVASPNGAACSAYGRRAPHLFVGALNNARAVAAAVSSLLDRTTLCVTVVACGERWKAPTEDGDLRFAIEDYLGAGAILSRLSHARSPEARACAAAFVGARDDLPQLIEDCGSGRELRVMGFGQDAVHAARLDCYDAVPVMRGERLERLEP
jgi:2-phosphosulfolactate phosphatase